MAATDGQIFTAISADTAAFQLNGGRYGIVASGSWNGGSFTLKALGPDGSTYVTMATAISADGYVVVELPPGTYKLIEGGSVTSANIGISRIPKQ